MITKGDSKIHGDWLYDAIMKELAPELTTRRFDEKAVLQQRKDETSEEHAARIASYEVVFDAFESILKRIERTYVTRARQRKEEMRNRLREREQRERDVERKHVEHLFEE